MDAPCWSTQLCKTSVETIIYVEGLGNHRTRRFPSLRHSIQMIGCFIALLAPLIVVILGITRLMCALVDECPVLKLSTTQRSIRPIERHGSPLTREGKYLLMNYLVGSTSMMSRHLILTKSLICVIAEL